MEINVLTFISSGSFNKTYEWPKTFIWTIDPYCFKTLPKYGKTSENKIITSKVYLSIIIINFITN